MDTFQDFTENVLEYILSIREENLLLTILNVSIVFFAILGIVILVRSYMEHVKERRRNEDDFGRG